MAVDDLIDNDIEDVEEEESTVYSGFVDELPGCCGAALISDMQKEASDSWGGDLEAESIPELIKECVAKAKEGGWGLVMATHVEAEWIEPMIEAGFEDIYQWVNPRTKNTIHLLVKKLTRLKPSEKMV